MGAIRENWRVALLVIVLLVSTFALFSPTLAQDEGAEATEASDGPTNLQFGLELSGGTRIRAPLIGVHASDVAFADNVSTATVEQDVAAELDNVTVSDVTARYTGEASGTVEVTAEGVTTADLGAALDAAGYDYDEVQDGVTDRTREQTVRVLRSKINEAGLSGGAVRSVRTPTGEYFVVIEVPNENRSDVIDLVNERGKVEVHAYYQTEDGNYTNRTVLTRDDFGTIGTATQSDRIGPHVPVTVKESQAERFQNDMVETGVAKEGGSTCTYNQNPESTEPCLLIVVDGEVTNAFGMDSSLARDMRSGEWAKDPQFVLVTTNFSEAQDVAINLRAGALPAALDIGPDGEGSSMFIAPSQSERFKTDALITGIIAVLAVSGVVFLRYGSPKVALPMIVTALSEVVVLLGFAAAIGYPIDLSVIAGFIAVIGTGVDDLVIIADEVMSQGEVNSRRVFQSRFRKAFWVIGAAAATTIIAMSPLAVLSLGDLKGFAIFTILGVLVGVLITRPAYGDILRALLTGDH